MSRAFLLQPNININKNPIIEWGITVVGNYQNNIFVELPTFPDTVSLFPPINVASFPAGYFLNIQATLELDSFEIVNSQPFVIDWKAGGIVLPQDGLIYVASDEILPPVAVNITLYNDPVNGPVLAQGVSWKNGSIGLDNRTFCQNAVVFPPLAPLPVAPFLIEANAYTTVPPGSGNSILTSSVIITLIKAN